MDEVRRFCMAHGTSLAYQLKTVLGDKVEPLYEALVRCGLIAGAPT